MFKNIPADLAVFCNETVGGGELRSVYNKVEVSRGMLPGENLNFQNLRNAIFWH